jgi:murein L,D-transpeptidase YcbB/YkuD
VRRHAPLILAVLVVIFIAQFVRARRAIQAKYVPQEVPAILGIQALDIAVEIAVRIDSQPAPQWITPGGWKRVRALYEKYDHAPLWLEPEGVKNRATALLEALQAAPQHALLTDRYPIDSIRRVIESPVFVHGGTARDLANADVVLTAAYVGYATDMLVGQVDPRSISQSWHIRVKQAVVDSALAHALEDTSMKQGLTAMAPQDSEYAVLKQEYGRYQQYAKSGGWKVLERGVSTEELTARLQAEGYTIDSTTGPTKALKTFQERHGLAPDGVVGKGTFAALNVPAAERVTQIASNLERHRWLPRSLGSRYIYVNVPSFRLDAYDTGQRVLTMKVVVGAEYQGKNTPVFSDSMKSVVFRPFWNVPPEIQKKEITPKVAKDTGYLARNDMEYYHLGGTRFVRQRPGPKNALGYVKFLFPNDFNIYMHDTPEKDLFAQSARAASHGCVRLERPADLAQLVLGWTKDSVRAAMNTGPDNRTVPLPQKIPVYIVYFTAYARDGHLYFGEDLYKRDDELKSRLELVAP